MIRMLVLPCLAVMMLAVPVGASGQSEGAQGILEWSSGTCYAGELREGKPHGQGIIISSDGSCYKGGFRDGKPHGAGVFITRDGRRFSGSRIGDILALGEVWWPARPEWLEPEPEPLCDCEKIKDAVRDGE